MAYSHTDKFAFKMSFTGIEVPIDVLEAAIQKENPTIYFSDADCRYWMFDFSFEWNGKTYWIEMTSEHDPWINGAVLNVYR